MRMKTTNECVIILVHTGVVHGWSANHIIKLLTMMGTSYRRHDMLRDIRIMRAALGNLNEPCH